MRDPQPLPVLIVDDDPAIVSAVADVLRMEGYEVDTAGNGAAALTRVEDALPGLVLLDMRMPVLDGWGFARALRERGVRVPTVIMTAAHDAAVWASEIGADGYLPKPFQIQELLDVVARHVSPTPEQA